jgi:carbon-monoxide dehydrogenase medium subunit
MFPPQFDYRNPGDLDTALAALAQDGAVALAGGHDLIPTLKRRDASPETVVDLNGLDELRGVAAGERHLTIGALTTYASLLESDPAGVDALLDATAAVGDTQIRNRGTVGGNIAAAHPASDIPAAALVLDATVHLTGPEGDRTVPADAFYVDDQTACGDAELLTELSVPLAADDGSAYVRKTHPSTGYAALGVAAGLTLDGEAVSAARVGVTGLFDRPVRLEAAESALAGVDATDETEVANAAARAGDGIEETRVREDHLVSAEQRLRLLPTYTKRAIARARDRAAERTGVNA